MNSITFVGRIGRDAEYKTGQGWELCSFPVASNGRKDKNGVEVTTWFECTIWGKRAGHVHSHLKKGDRVAILSGEISLDVFTKTDGTTSAKIKCNVNEFEFASDRQQQGQQAPQQRQQAPQGYQQQQQQQQQQQRQPQQQPPAFEDFDDDIPF